VLISPAETSTLNHAIAAKLSASALLNNHSYSPDFLAKFQETSGNGFHARRYAALKEKLLAAQSTPQFPAKYAEDLDVMSESAHLLGANSIESNDFQQLLTTIRLRRSDLSFGKISSRFPVAAQRSAELRTKHLFLTMQPEDPLFIEDISKHLIDGDWTELRPGPYAGKGFNVTIRKLRFNEKESPEKTETRVVGNIELSFAALLFVPRNASMQYEVISSSAEIDYGFELSIALNGALAKKKIVRDRLASAGRKCANIRYVNVFGGIGTSPVFPNNNVESFCNTGNQGDTIEELRSKIYYKLSEEIKGELSQLQGGSSTISSSVEARAPYL
jgi:hypothetical protein